MDLVAIEQSLLQTAATLVIDPRVLRRVIKADRNASGLVPHAHSYTMSRDALCQIVGQAELGVAPAHLPEQLILLARPSSRSFSGRSEAQVLTRFWRAIFHARVHQVLEDLAHRGVLDSPGLRERIERLGQTEFDEVRSTLLHDDLVLPPCSDQEVYIEFAALYLELRYFAPGLLVTTFPGLASFELVDDALAADVDVTPLLEQGRPAQVAPPVARTLSGTKAPSYSAPAAFGLAEAVTLKPVSPRKHQRLLDGAEKARKKGNDVRAALLCARAAHVPDPEAQRAAQSAAKKDLAQLGARVSRALEPPGGASETFAPSWSSLLLILGDRAASERALRYSVEARLLFTVQKAAIAFERPNRAVSVATWMFSRGKRPIVRDLPSTRELRVARYLQVAAKMVRHTRVGAADRKLLGKLLDWATDRADANVRAALRPKLLAVFEQVGLVAASAPEQLARHKLIEELLDEVVTRGFISFASLRDALSRNQLKLQDLSGGRELISGDALLKADAALAIELDGIYRRGEIYLRGMQKASSIPFGTRVGRVLTLYLILPVGAAFLLLEGVGHIIGPLLVKLGFARIRPLNLTSLAICSALILALLHSAAFRAFAKQLLDVISWVFVALFLRLPRALFSRPAVRRIFQLPLVRLTIRRVLIPVAIAVGVFFIPPLRRHDLWLTLAVCFGSFAVSSLVLGSRLGAWVEDLFFDQLAPTWHVVSRQLVPGLFRFIARMFAGLMDLLQRGIYRIDELMLFRDGQNPIMLVLKATVGMVWGTIAYVIRLYVTLLIEPEVNPLKHFPVVTVAHKLMLPWTPAMLAALRTPLAPFGDVVANTIAGVTVF